MGVTLCIGVNWSESVNIRTSADPLITHSQKRQAKLLLKLLEFYTCQSKTAFSGKNDKDASHYN